MIQQLRIYTINRGALDDFAAEWAETIKPLRCEIGFTVEGAWKIRETNQFAWILSYEGKESWEKLDQAYHNSPKRHAMQPDPARHITRMEHFFMEAVP